MSLIESFKKTVAFFDEIRREGLIYDCALIGGLALSVDINPVMRNGFYWNLEEIERMENSSR